MHKALTHQSTSGAKLPCSSQCEIPWEPDYLLGLLAGDGKERALKKISIKWHRHAPGSFPRRGQRNTHRRTWDCIKAPLPVPATPSKSASAGHCFLGFLASCNVTQVRNVPETERKSLFTDPPLRQPTSPLLPAWATCGFVLLSPRLLPLGQKYRQDRGF